MAARKYVWVADSSGHFTYGARAVGRTEQEAFDAVLKAMRDLYGEHHLSEDDSWDDYIRTDRIEWGQAVTT